MIIRSKAQLRGGEEPIDHHVRASHAIIDELAVARGANDEERRHFTLGDAAREFDIDLAAVVEGAQRAPGGGVAFNRIAEIKAPEIDACIDRHNFLGRRVAPA